MIAFSGSIPVGFLRRYDESHHWYGVSAPWLSALMRRFVGGLIVAATASGAQSCGPNPDNAHQFGNDSIIYNCHLDIRGPLNQDGYVAYYVRNYCTDPLDVPQRQVMTLWVESRAGLFDDWRQLGKAKPMNGRPSFPSGQTTLVVGGVCQTGTDVRLAWKVLGTTAAGTDFGPINDAQGSGDPAPC